MDLISRKDAIARGLKSYFTGEQCKHGHIAPRYVLNGGCSECIKLANYRNPDVGIIQNARRIAIATLIRVNIRAFAKDYAALAAAAYALAIARYPQLQISDVDPKLIPKDRQAGTGLYAFNCHIDDEVALKSIGLAMLHAHTKNMDEYRQRSLQAAQGLVNSQEPDKSN